MFLVRNFYPLFGEDASNESCWFDRAYGSHVASPEAAAFESFALPIRTASILDAAMDRNDLRAKFKHYDSLSLSLSMVLRFTIESFENENVKIDRKVAASWIVFNIERKTKS